MENTENTRREFIGNMAKTAAAATVASFAVPLAATANETTPNTASACPVVFFELGCKDLAKTTGFYTDLFGWSKTSVPYASQINTNTKEGVQGQIVSLGHEPHQYVTFYVQVEDINAMLTKVEAAGGKKIVGPIPLPDKTQFAWFKDPEGNMVAMITKV